MNELSKQEFGVQAYDLDGILPDMDEMEVLPIDLSVDYWTPEKPGESKRLFFTAIKEESRINEETGEAYEAEVAYFVEQMPDGTHKRIINQSVKMVGSMKGIQAGTPLQITYTGKKRTQSGHNIDTWAIQPLVRRNTVQTETNDDEDIFS